MTTQGYDGSINVDTRVDTKGMKKGTTSITQQLGGVMRAITRVGRTLAKVFSIGSLILFSATLAQIFASIRESAKTLFERMGKSAELEKLQAHFAELKMAIANAFLPLIVAALPYINKVISSMIQLLNKVAMFTAAWTGAKQAMQIVEGSTKKVANNTDKIRKNAQGALAAFDQINVLDTNKDTGLEVESPVNVLTEMVPITDSIIDKVTKIKEKIAEIWKTIVGIWDGAKEKIGEFLTWLNTELQQLGKWIEENPEKFKVLVIVLGLIALAVLALIVILGLFLFVLANFATIMFIAEVAAAAFGLIMTVIFSPIGLVIAIILLLIGAIVNLILWWPVLKAVAIFALEKIKEAWAKISTWFTENVTIPLREAFAKALVNIITAFMNTFDKIKTFVADVVNNIIGIVNEAIAGIMGAFNDLSGNSSVGVQVTSNLDSNAVTPRIPRLATGAVIPANAEFAAILGDQKSGKNIETPVNLMRETFEDALSKALENQTVDIRFNGSLGELVRILKPEIDKESRRQGKSLIVGGH